jgi:hypothetical protein
LEAVILEVKCIHVFFSYRHKNETKERGKKKKRRRRRSKTTTKGTG